MRQIILRPDFDQILAEESVAPISVVAIYFESLEQCAHLLKDVGFLQREPTAKIQSAIDLSIILKRFAEIFISFKGRDNYFDAKWSPGFLQLILSKMHKWDMVMLESPLEESDSTHLLIALRRTLLTESALAIKHILESTKIFQDGLPQDILSWLIFLEKRGFRILSPSVLYNHESILGLVLAESYG